MVNQRHQARAPQSESVTSRPSRAVALKRATRHSRRTIMLVSKQPRMAELAAALLTDTSDHDVIVLESTAHAYTQIRQFVPDLVIVFADVEDAAACQLLTMVRLDDTLAGVSVVTCDIPSDSASIEAMANIDGNSLLSLTVSAPMN